MGDLRHSGFVFEHRRFSYHNRSLSSPGCVWDINKCASREGRHQWHVMLQLHSMYGFRGTAVILLTSIHAFRGKLPRETVTTLFRDEL